MEAQPSPEVGVEPGASEAAAPPLALSPGRRAAWSIGLSLLILAQIGVGIRSRIDDDDRYGFAMFHEFTALSLRYRWVYPDGRTEEIDTDGYLRGRAKAVRGAGRRTEVFGAGTTRIQAQGFVRWLYENKRPEGVVAAQVVYAWERNKDGEHHRELLIWPPVEARP